MLSYNVKMCNFGRWIACYIFFATCAFGYQVESTRNNISTYVVLPYNTSAENVSSPYSDDNDLNSKSKGGTHLLNVEQNAIESTPIPESNNRHIGFHPASSSRKFHNSKAITLHDVNNYIALLHVKNPKESTKDSNRENKSYSIVLHSKNHFDVPERHHTLPPDLLKIKFREGKRDECLDNYECQQFLKYSTCAHRITGNVCRCLSGYISSFRECLEKANVGDDCRLSLQCPVHSACVGDTCICVSGYVRKGFECVNRSNFDPPNFILALIAGVVFLIVASCLFVIIMALRRKLTRARRNSLCDDTPTISGMVDARRPISPDPSYQRIDKPPTYEEAVSSSTLLTLDIQGVSTSEPPSYTQAQRESRYGHFPDAP